MITVKSDRSVYIPECDRHIGYENDNLVEQRIFEICDSSLFGFSFKLDLKKTLDIVDLAPCGETENSRLFSWNITSAAIGEGGAIIAQLRAFNESGEKVWHSEWLEFVAEPSVNAEKEINDERVISEFEQLEVRVQKAVTGIEGAAANAEESATGAALSANSAESSAQIADAERAAAEIAADSAEKASKAASQSEANAKAYSEQARDYNENAYLDMTSAKASAATASEAATRAGQAEKYVSDNLTAFQGAVQSFNEHSTNNNNPHLVTAEQTGAYTKEEMAVLLGEKAASEHTHSEAVSAQYTDIDFTKYTSPRNPEAEDMYKIYEDRIYGGGMYFDVSVRGYVNLEFSSNTQAYIDIDGTEYDISYGETALFEGEIKDSFVAYASAGDIIFTKRLMKTGASSGLMSASDKVKLDGIEDGANKTQTDLTLDGGSSNPIANSAVFSEFESIKNTIGDIDSALDGIIAIEENLMAV